MPWCRLKLGAGGWSGLLFVTSPRRKSLQWLCHWYVVCVWAAPCPGVPVVTWYYHRYLSLCCSSHMCWASLFTTYLCVRWVFERASACKRCWFSHPAASGRSGKSIIAWILLFQPWIHGVQHSKRWLVLLLSWTHTPLVNGLLPSVFLGQSSTKCWWSPCFLGKPTLLPSVSSLQPSSVMILLIKCNSLCENTILLCTVYCVQVSADVKTPVLGIWLFFRLVCWVFLAWFAALT